MFIKKHIVADTVMTASEAKRFDVAMREFKTGKTTPLGSLKKQLGL